MHQVSRAMPLKHLSIVMQRPLHAFFTSTSHLNNSVAARRRSINASSGLRNEKDDRKLNGKMLMIAKQVVKDSDEFFVAASNLKEKLLKALLPLKDVNDPFVLTTSDNEGSGLDIILDLGPVIGQYSIQFDMDQHFLIFVSPISGQTAYNFTKSGEWCSDEDGHNFEGMLVRDLIRQIKGVPNL